MDRGKMEEEKKVTRLPFFGIGKIIPYVRAYRGIMAVMIILGCLSSLIDSAYPLFNRYALDHFIGERTLSGLRTFILLYLGILIFQVADNFVTAYLCGKVEMSVDRDLRNDAFNHIQTLSFSYFNRNSVGYIHARVMSDTGLIGEVISWRMMNLVWNGAYVIGVLVVMLIIDVRLAALICLLVPIAVLFMMYFHIFRNCIKPKGSLKHQSNFAFLF